MEKMYSLLGYYWVCNGCRRIDMLLADDEPEDEEQEE
jgi:hypothetical protein